jgi:aconitate hydratase
MDFKSTKSTFQIKNKKFSFFSLKKFANLGFKDIEILPFSIKVLLESALRNCDDYKVTQDAVKAIANWSAELGEKKEIVFMPGRVILQDFTGVPCMVDLAAMRDGMKALGGDDKKINPKIPCDLVIDHSVQTDFYGNKNAFAKNLKKEFQRNHERYAFLKWGQNAFKNFRVIPPAMGIIHQINLEYLAQGVLVSHQNGENVVYPDSLVGTDSHTTMINGLGIVGWGVGGIEAEAVMLGEPLNMLMPEVIGFRLKGKLPQGVTPTDLVLKIVQLLRREGVVDKFIEYFGDGVENLSLPSRAMIANMAPEYGATLGFFPADQKTLDYYRFTGRSKEQVDLLEYYLKEQGMFYSADAANKVRYTKTLDLDLNTVDPSLAGPKRPQDRVSLNLVPESFAKNFPDLASSDTNGLVNGSVVIASITSCTNTSDPFVLIAAGILAKNAVERGLKVKSFVKTSLAPGSRVVVEYLRKAGLLSYLEKLGFNLVGYGCMTCIGNSGPLDKKIADSIKRSQLTVASVLSGNRNFEGRINPLVKANYLASPPLVVAYALAGNIHIDLTHDPLGKDLKGQDVYLKDLWPSEKEIESLIKKCVKPLMFQQAYRHVLSGTTEWRKIKSKTSDLYAWKKKSTYIHQPPFFIHMKQKPDPVKEIEGARILAVLGDSITTDHISPAGAIAYNSPAGKYLQSFGIQEKDFNSYGSRRGNDEIMTRGTFANIRLKNLLVPGHDGSWTVHFPSQEQTDIFSAAMKYKQDTYSFNYFCWKRIRNRIIA